MALYSVWSTVNFSAASVPSVTAGEDASSLRWTPELTTVALSGVVLLVVSGTVREKTRRTSGESSASTLKARRAEDAR